MKQPNSEARFFGLNLRQLRSDWSSALNQMARWPVLRWLTPVYVTRIKTANGETADYVERQEQVVVKQSRPQKVRFFGFLLPQNLVLWHTMALPRLAGDASQAAIELEVKSLSPFVSDDLVWAHTALIPAAQGSTTQIVIASRKIIAQHIALIESPPPRLDSVEIWATLPQGDSLFVLKGFGEKKRRELSARWRVVNLFLVFMLAAIGFAAAVTPTAQLRLRAIKAAQDYQQLGVLAAPALQQRDLLVRFEQQTTALQAQLTQGLKPELILLRITKLLPDDTYVTQLQAKGDKFKLTGQTPNTAALMQQLGAQAGVKDVRAPNPAVKPRGAERETFNIEFTLDPSSLTPPP